MKNKKIQPDLYYLGYRFLGTACLMAFMFDLFRYMQSAPWITILFTFISIIGGTLIWITCCFSCIVIFVIVCGIRERVDINKEYIQKCMNAVPDSILNFFFNLLFFTVSVLFFVLFRNIYLSFFFFLFLNIGNHLRIYTK